MPIKLTLLQLKYLQKGINDIFRKRIKSGAIIAFIKLLNWTESKKLYSKKKWKNLNIYFNFNYKIILFNSYLI